MSKMVVEKGYFKSHGEVMEDVRDSGYWPATYISNKSPELPIHYHDKDASVVIASTLKRDDRV
jgi:hypothetical protein